MGFKNMPMKQELRIFSWCRFLKRCETPTRPCGPIPNLEANWSSRSGIHTVMIVPTGNFVGYNTISDR